MWLTMRLYMLLALMFGIVYAVIVVAGAALGIHGFSFYIIMAVLVIGVQYLLGPWLVEKSMRVRYVSETENPVLNNMITELAHAAGIPKPRIGISQIPIPNAFAFGKWTNDGRVCVTQPLMDLLSREELRAVLGHEITHLKNHDMAFITMLSVIPMILWYLAWNLMFSRRRDNTGALLGLGALIMYFATNLLVLYGSRIREYYADKGSIELGNPPHQLASALYKLVYGSARIPKKTLKMAEGYKAFFASDPSMARNEIKELKEVDRDLSGTIDEGELKALRDSNVHITGSDTMMEIFSTHPNMLKRIKILSM